MPAFRDCAPYFMELVLHAFHSYSLLLHDILPDGTGDEIRTRTVTDPGFLRPICIPIPSLRRLKGEDRARTCNSTLYFRRERDTSGVSHFRHFPIKCHLYGLSPMGGGAPDIWFVCFIVFPDF